MGAKRGPQMGSVGVGSPGLLGANCGETLQNQGTVCVAAALSRRVAEGDLWPEKDGGKWRGRSGSRVCGGGRVSVCVW